MARLNWKRKRSRLTMAIIPLPHTVFEIHLGQRVGYPIFKNGAELYETKDIIYNFKTKRARITEVVTQQGEAFFMVIVVYKNENGELLSQAE